MAAFSEFSGIFTWTFATFSPRCARLAIRLVVWELRRSAALAVSGVMTMEMAPAASLVSSMVTLPRFAGLSCIRTRSGQHPRHLLGVLRLYGLGLQVCQAGVAHLHGC